MRKRAAIESTQHHTPEGATMADVDKAAAAEAKAAAKAAWLTERLAYFRTLKNPAEHQTMMLLLGVKPDLTPGEKKQLAAAVALEAIEQRRQKSAEDFKRISADPDSKKKERDHRMYQAAGLLSMAGLIDKDGTLKHPSDALLGGLLGLAEVQDPRRWEAWALKGAALMAERAAAKKAKATAATATDPAGAAPVQDGSRKEEGGSSESQGAAA
jgi:hypothetical protein